MGTKARRERLYREFWQWGLDERGWSKNTRDMRMRIARSADRWLTEHHEIPLLFAEEQDLRKYLFKLPPNAYTRNAYPGALRWFLLFLIKNGHRKDNPAEALPHVPQVPGLPKAFGKREADRTAKSAHLFGLDVEAMVLLALFAGLRRSEIRWLEWASIDLEEGWISVKREGGAKGGRERAVPIHPELSDVLRGWKRESEGSGRYVFESTIRIGQPWSLTHIGRQFHSVGDDAGVHLHLPRHTFATHLLDVDGNLRTVQGHDRPLQRHPGFRPRPGHALPSVRPPNAGRCSRLCASAARRSPTR